MKQFIVPALLLFGLPAAAQKDITVEDYTTRTTFAHRSVNDINWMKDGKFYSALNDNKIIRYDVTTGSAVETILDGAALQPAIEIEGYSFSADENKVIVSAAKESIYRRSYTAEYFVYDRSEKSLKQV